MREILVICFGLGVLVYSSGEAVPKGQGGKIDEVASYVSLKAGKVYMRVGPSKQYPISWVYYRKGLPVEVLEAYENWRKVRDPEGGEGWVHWALLSTTRTVYVAVATGVLDSPKASHPIAIAEQGVVARLVYCGEEFCKLRFGTNGVSGWSSKASLWGVR